MKAAIVTGPAQAPVFTEFPAPEPAEGEKLVTVSASAISHVVKGRASGRHYSAGASFPFGIGIDGVGRIESGERVYFVLPRAPFGSFAELSLVPEQLCISLPDELDDLTAAAIANPGMSSWMALTERAQFKPGQTVLVNGATGTSGRLAVQIARHLGAGRVIATGRNPAALDEVAGLGADVTIPLDDDAEAFQRRLMMEFAQGVDCVIDYLWGKPAESVLIAAAKAGRDAVPMRFVQVGSIAGDEIALPSAVLRANAIELLGSGSGSVAAPRVIAVLKALFDAVVPAGLAIAFREVPFERFDEAWRQDDSTRRTVFKIGDATGR